ncbi:MAG: dihydroxyacetone kinase subunit L [Microbacterium ginsengisoli]|uniref:dihydroxyacetone kinase subunit DhaL n=1 Tax=Microbacterium TaxID=33882 RepID=UPI0006F485CB|nr:MULTISPECIES: dihydroxyacetone kinase subunit DhaL [unclassified Microbacterium]MBN9198435.1 dihydroxyacetone kinase subunit L [Microbacterium ginsengisoli]KQR95774.1 dihydroxyacetone kinase [Microbacterium sp. Leaf351]KQR99106.1 dihydroxyacetone kinase [Microbacterium sp. Leaf347]ODU78077.1 MAG: dihydroxyacetone kinase subunit L [Microbacterium sp. SCN 71-21]OJU78159.1 MAG: dihydroxyacetone kinase subunit L [Microbacterium sp. 71-23]
MADVITVAQLEAWLRAASAALHEKAAWLTELDSAIGDADHGTNMARGFTAVVTKLDAGVPDTAPALLKSVGMTLISTVGGASGSLYGTLFLEAAKALPADSEVTAAQFAEALAAGVAGIVSRGHAEIGDKTMIDALTPAVAAFAAAAAGESAADAAASAARAGEAGRDSTEPLVARKGRASYLGERSAGHLDPGASSSVILLETLAGVLAA